jgi:DivIVA domain-containing protein
VVSTSFQRASRFGVGYDPQQVDDFLSRARTAYEGGEPGFDGSSVAAASFDTQRGGYDMRAVDDALDRLSDAFALRARDEAIDATGEAEWVSRLTERADGLKERLERPAGERFAPGTDKEPAYDRADVDALCDQLVGYFTAGVPMSVDDVRRAAFRRRKGADGYQEAVVDVYLDHVADLMASVP